MKSKAVDPDKLKCMAHFLGTQPIVQVNLPPSQSMHYAHYAQESSVC